MQDAATATQPLTILSEEELMFRDAVREFAESEVRPHVEEMDAAGQFRKEIIPKFFELGLMGIEVPEKWGGADATIFPNYGGRFGYSVQTCGDIADASRMPWHALAPAMPVPAGGMSVARVPEMHAFFGDDTMLLIGGGLLLAHDNLLARCREFVAAVAANGER